MRPIEGLKGLDSVSLIVSLIVSVLKMPLFALIRSALRTRFMWSLSNTYSVGRYMV
jgi:type III secretory pathway component EscU